MGLSIGPDHGDALRPRTPFLPDGCPPFFADRKVNNNSTGDHMHGRKFKELLIEPEDFAIAPAFCLRTFANMLRQRDSFPLIYKAATAAVTVVAIEHDLNPVIAHLSGPDDLPDTSDKDDEPDLVEVFRTGPDVGPHLVPRPRPRPKRRPAHSRPLASWEGINLDGILSAIDGLLESGDYPDRTVVFNRHAGIAARVLGLDEIEEAIVGLALTLENNRHACAIYDRVFARTTNLVDSLAVLLNIDRTEIKTRMSVTAPLICNGILRIDSNFENILRPELLSALEEALTSDLDGPDDLVQRLLGMPEETALEAEDFKHLESDFKTLCSLLWNATAYGARGVNILLYGRPGTGKTEFAKLLANTTGMPLYSAGATDDGGREPVRNERLNAYLMFQHLMGESNRVGLCLFDEADDIFGIPHPFSRRAPGSKLFTNHMVENNPVPTIWIVNDPDELPASIRRRMSHALHVDLPPARVRERILGKICARHDLKLEQAEIKGLANRFPVPPAVYDKMAQSTKLAEGDAGLADKVLVGLCEALGVTPTSRPGAFVTKPFLPEISCADLDLDDFTRRLALIGKGQGFSMCLYGAPGTGKSAFATHVAGQLGLEVEKVRASDILGPYVGQSEANIRRLFAQSARQGSFLIIDEADSLLQDRSNAHHSWEVTQVNELLVAMEQHPLPFACTTNLMERLDRAAMRRFTFGIRFDTLTPHKAKTCFQHYFGLTPPRALASLSGLVPADFAVVARRAEILGGANDADRLMSMLGDELRKRGEEDSPAIGFHVTQRARSRAN